MSIEDGVVDDEIIARYSKWMEEKSIAFECPVYGQDKRFWECPELCVSGPVHAVWDTQGSKRSPNIMAN
ncbi:MAG: hypothetical protein ACU0B9_06860 [Limimaricola soesokkakensis]|uniref:hypothetical protein n=1 Tax=Limimaricola soesokkakensis TaxID=1343159 RepID=UPI0040587AC3